MAGAGGNRVTTGDEGPARQFAGTGARPSPRAIGSTTLAVNVFFASERPSVYPHRSRRTVAGMVSPPEDQTQDKLASLRSRLDAVDAGIHRLLRERFEIVVDIAAAKGPGESVIRPAREAAVIENRLSHHTGAMARETLVHLWRVIVAAACAAQRPLTIHVAGAVEAARFLYGPVPARLHDSASAAVGALGEAPGDVAVIDAATADVWWRARGEAHVIARLPLSDGGTALAIGGGGVSRGTGPLGLVARGETPPVEVSAAEIGPDDDVVGRYHPFPVIIPVAERHP